MNRRSAGIENIAAVHTENKALIAYLAHDDPAGRGSPLGRPVDYSPMVGAGIVRRLLGGETVAQVCADPDMPDLPTVSLWRLIYPSFDEAIDSARTIQAAYRADQAYAAVHKAADKDAAYIARVQADVYLRLAARQDPARFAERRDSGPAVSVTINTDVQGPSADRGPGGAYVIDLSASSEPETAEKPLTINDLL